MSGLGVLNVGRLAEGPGSADGGNISPLGGSLEFKEGGCGRRGV